MVTFRKTHVLGPGHVISRVAIGAITGRLRDGSGDDTICSTSNRDRAGIRSSEKYEVRGNGRDGNLHLSSPRARISQRRDVQE